MYKFQKCRDYVILVLMGSLNNCFSDLEVFFKRAALDHYNFIHCLCTPAWNRFSFHCYQKLFSIYKRCWNGTWYVKYNHFTFDIYHAFPIWCVSKIMLLCVIIYKKYCFIAFKKHRTNVTFSCFWNQDSFHCFSNVVN